MAPQDSSLPPLTLTLSAAVCVGWGVGLCVGFGDGLGVGCRVGPLVVGAVAAAWVVAACVVGCAAGRLDDGAEECGAVLAADTDDDEVAS
jgi:hypothetical protein